MSAADPEHTLLGVVFPATLPESAGRRALRLTGEAIAVTAVSAYLPVRLDFDEAGLISLFLVAAALSDRFDLLLDENRRNIWERHVGGWRSNRLTVIGFFAIFGGIFAGYALIASLLDAGRVATFFEFTLQAAALGGETLRERNFGSFTAILAPNVGVLVVTACLAFVYRTFGTMLVLGWNACVWAIVIMILALRGVQSSELPRVVSLAVALAAVLPHLMLESLAYISTSLAFLFASKGLSTYHLRDPRLRQVLAASIVLFGVGCTALLLGAAAEAYFAPLILRHM